MVGSTTGCLQRRGVLTSCLWDGQPADQEEIRSFMFQPKKSLIQPLSVSGVSQRTERKDLSLYIFFFNAQRYLYFNIGPPTPNGVLIYFSEAVTVKHFGLQYL